MSGKSFMVAPVRMLETLEEVRDHMTAPMARTPGRQSSIAMGYDTTGKVIVVRMEKREASLNWAAGEIDTIPHGGFVRTDLAENRDRTVFDRAGFRLPLHLVPALASKVES